MAAAVDLNSRQAPGFTRDSRKHNYGIGTANSSISAESPHAFLSRIPNRFLIGPSGRIPTHSMHFSIPTGNV